VAQGEATWDAFLARFGQRATGEMELAEPRWREDRSYLERMAESFRRGAGPSPEERHAHQVAARRATESELPKLLAAAGGSSLREPIERDLREAQALLPYRELGKYHLMQAYAALREALVELGQRWDLGRDLFFLTLGELPEFDQRPLEFRQQIAARKLRWKSAQKLALADVIDSRDLASLGKPQASQPTGGDGVVEARPIASGVAAGIARIVFDPREAGDLGSDYILVCPSTDPGWTPLFMHAKGLIVERGGVLSHGAIVARDFGLPAVVYEDATRRIPDGARIEVDGNRGRISWL
jgi:pyruvate,water dikinase